jgi:hypothetical protein
LTDAQLHGLAAQACNMCKRDMERREFDGFFLAAYNASDERPLFRMVKIEKLLNERLGEDWLNSGRTKDCGFGLLRACIDTMPPDAIIIATVANRFKPTEKFYKQLTAEEQRNLLDATHDQHHEAAKATRCPDCGRADGGAGLHLQPGDRRSLARR